MTLKEALPITVAMRPIYSCHARIDPWGIAFENYDALGSYRTKIENEPVDAAALLFQQATLGRDEWTESYLLQERQDQFATHGRKDDHLCPGRPLSFSDHAEVEDLAAEFRKKGDRLGDLVLLVIQSGILTRSNPLLVYFFN